MPREFQHLINGMCHAPIPEGEYSDTPITHHWRSGDEIGTAQYWQPGEPAPTGDFPRNPWPAYDQGRRRGRFEGFVGGAAIGDARGHWDGYQTAFFPWYEADEFRHWGYTHRYPQTRRLGYMDGYGEPARLDDAVGCEGLHDERGFSYGRWPHEHDGPTYRYH